MVFFGNGNALFHLANRSQVFVQLALIRGAKSVDELLDALPSQVENALSVERPASASLGRKTRVDRSKQTLENGPGIDFNPQGCFRVFPGKAVGVSAT